MTYTSLGHMPRAPLVYSLAMIEYAPVPRMADFAADIMEELREEYPDSNKYTVKSVRLDVSGSPSNVAMEQQQIDQWRMNNAAADFGIVFGHDRVVFHTATYDHFHGFAQKIGPVAGIIANHAKIKYSRRIGIRHIDNILPIDEMGFSDLLNPGYLCPRQNAMLRPQSSRVEFIYQSNIGQFFARCYQLEGHPKIPQDLFQLAEQLPGAKLMEPIEENFVLADTDHIYQPEKFEDFDIERIINTLNQLHEQNSLGFRSMVTPAALTAWRQE